MQVADRNPLVVMLMVPATTGIAAWLPFSPLAWHPGFVPMPGQFRPLLALTRVCYVGLTQLIKSWMLRKNWI